MKWVEKLTEQEGFEPPLPFGTTVFKTDIGLRIGIMRHGFPAGIQGDVLAHDFWSW